MDIAMNSWASREIADTEAGMSTEALTGQAQPFHKVSSWTPLASPLRSEITNLCEVVGGAQGPAEQLCRCATRDPKESDCLQKRSSKLTCAAQSWRSADKLRGREV